MKIYNTAVRLRQLMNEKDIKQIDILRMAQPYCDKYSIKLGKSDLSQFVSGKVEPGQSKLTIIGLALNVSEAWLMGYDVPMERENLAILLHDTAEYLTGKTDIKEKPPQSEDFSNEDIEIAKKLRLLTQEQKLKVEGYVDSFLNK